MNKLRFTFIISILALLSAPSAFAYDRGCFAGLTQCTRAMTASLAGWGGVHFEAACEEEATGDYAHFSYTYSHRRYYRAFDSYVTCLQELRRSLTQHVIDLSIYSACEHSRGGERTFTGGLTPPGQFCFEYRFSE
jgi:hypothetical protein